MSVQGRMMKQKVIILIQTFLIIALMVGLTAFVGLQLFGRSAFLYAGILGAAMLLFTPRLTPRALFASGNVVPISRYDTPELYDIVHRLKKRAGLSREVQLGYLPSPTVNALTVGNRSDAAVIVTQGLLRSLPRRELAGVLAHEISHIKNNDLWILTLGESVRRMTGLMSQTGVFLLLLNLPLLLFGQYTIPLGFIGMLIAAPGISLLLQLALSRRREFTADLGAVEITGDPDGLASALRIISNPRRSILDLFIPQRREPEGSVLLKTHPAVDERIRRLNEIGRTEREPVRRRISA